MIKYNENKNIIQIEERLFEIEIKRGDVKFIPTKENTSLEEIKEGKIINFVIDYDNQEELNIFNDGRYIFISECNNYKSVLYTYLVYNIKENKVIWFAYDSDYEDYYNFDDYINKSLKEICKY